MKRLVTAVAGGRPFLTDRGGFAAYRLSDGKELWHRFDVRLGAPVAAGGRVLLTRTAVDGAVAVSDTTGTAAWSTSARWAVVGPPRTAGASW